MTEAVATQLAVDVGGTKLLVGEVDEEGQLHQAVKYPSDTSSQKHATAQIESALTAYLRRSAFGRVQGISVSTVGLVEPDSGIWREIDPKRREPLNLKQTLGQKFHLPVSAANDVYCATVAENQLGIGQKTKDFIYINIGTGIAGRIVSGGCIVNGAHDNAGEIGHMVVDINSNERCVCGRYGCIEPLASGLGLSQHAEAFIARGVKTSLVIDASNRVDARLLFKAYDQGDAVAKAVINPALRGLAAMILNLLRVSDPEAVVLGGGVTNGGWLLAHMQPYLNDEAARLMRIGVIDSQLDPNRIAIIGAGLHGFLERKI